MLIFPFLKSNNSGFTLIELSIACCLSGFLFLLLMTFYSAHVRFSIELKQTAEQLENARYACFFIRNLFSQSRRIKSLSHKECSHLKVRPGTDGCELELRSNKNTKVVFLFISQSNALSAPPQPSYALFYKEQNKPRIEIASDVYSMKIVYGLRCSRSDNICSYEESNETLNWARVTSVKLSLLMQQGLLSKKWNLYLALNRTNSS